MPPWELLALFAASLLVGGVSSLLGLGGGVFLVPLLSGLLDVPVRDAASTSVVCTLATSATASIALDRRGLGDSGLVAELEVFAALGAVLGAGVLALILDPRVIYVLFALFVGYAALRMGQRAWAHTHGLPGTDVAPPPPSPLRYALGLFGCGLAGVATGLLGVGGGPIKVPVQTELLRVPLREAVANSNLMVGITAAAGAMVYLARGDVRVDLLGPCALGCAGGAYLGGYVAARIDANRLAGLFALLLALVTLSMVWKALALGA